jgi:hypothetical protein
MAILAMFFTGETPVPPARERRTCKTSVCASRELGREFSATA